MKIAAAAILFIPLLLQACATTQQSEAPLKRPIFINKVIAEGLIYNKLIDTENRSVGNPAREAWRSNTLKLCGSDIKVEHGYLEYSKPGSEVISMLEAGFRLMNGLGIDSQEISIIEGVVSCGDTPLSDLEVENLLRENNYII